MEVIFCFIHEFDNNKKRFHVERIDFLLTERKMIDIKLGQNEK